MGRPRSRSIKSRRSTAQRLVAFERLESRCVLSTMPLGAFGAGAPRFSSWDGQAVHGAPIETSLVSSPREHLTSNAAGALDSHRSFSKIQPSADGLSLRPSDSGFSDTWSSPTFGFEYSFKTFQVGGGFYSEFDSVRPTDAGSLLSSPPVMNINIYGQDVVVSETWFVIENSVAMPTVITPSLGVSPGAASSSVPDTSAELRTAEYGGKATAGPTSDPIPLPPRVGQQGPYATPEPAIIALPSSESTPATMSPAGGASVAASTHLSTSAAAVAIAAVPSVGGSPLSIAVNSTLSAVGRAESAGWSDWISMPSPEHSSQIVTASREVPAPHSAAAGLVLAAGVQHTSQAGASLLPLKVAASLVEMPIDLGRIEQTLTATIADIKRLSPDLAGWLNISHVSPLTVAFATAAIGGGSAYYYLRRRGGREANRQEDEESSSWLFSRLHSAASE